MQKAVWTNQMDGHFITVYIFFLTDKGLPVPNEVNQTMNGYLLMQKLNDYDKIKTGKTPTRKKEFSELTF